MHFPAVSTPARLLPSFSRSVSNERSFSLTRANRVRTIEKKKQTAEFRKMPRIVPIPRVDGEAARQRRKQPVPGNVCFPRVFPSPAANSGERVSIKGKEILNRFDGSTAHVRETDIRLLVWFIPSLLRLVHVTSQREGATNSYPGKRAFDSWSVHSLQTGKNEFWFVATRQERERETRKVLNLRCFIVLDERHPEYGFFEAFS